MAKKPTTKKATKTKKTPVRSKVAKPKKDKVAPLEDESVAIPIHTVPLSESSAEEAEPETEEPSLAEAAEVPEAQEDAAPPKQVKKVEGVSKDKNHALEPEAVEGVQATLPKKKEKPAKEKKPKKKRRVLTIILIVILILSALGVGAYYFFFGQTPFTGDKTNFIMEGPDSVVSGKEVEYRIVFENQEKVDFEDVEIDVVYPDGFTIVKAVPKSTNFNETKWGPRGLSKGEKIEVIITGKLVGNADDTKKISAKLSYKPQNVSSGFSEEKDVETKIEALDTELDISMPESITSGSEFTMDITVKNTADFDLEDLRVRFDYPSAFEYKSSKPRPDFGFDVFDISKLEKNDEEVIKIKGVITGEAKDKKQIKAVLGFVDDKNDFYPQLEKEVDIEIAKVLAEIDTKVYGTEENAMGTGETLEYKVHYKNSGTEAFQDVTIETEIDSKFLKPDSLEVDRGKVENGTVIWNKDTISELEKVNPGDEGDLSFKVKITDNIVVQKSEDKNFSIKARSFFKAKGTEGNPNSPVQVESKNAITKINSQVTVNTEGHYYDFEGRKVGSGPLPPAVGKKTTYRVYLLLSNKNNEVNEAVVEIEVPEGVSLTGSKSTNVGTITLESDKAVWSIGKIPAGTGQFSETLEAYFEVSLVPDLEQVGQAVNLTKSSIFKGLDAYTEEDLRVEMPAITTDLIEDPFSQGKGVVVEKELEFESSSVDDSSFDSLDEPSSLDTETESTQEEGVPIR